MLRTKGYFLMSDGRKSDAAKVINLDKYEV
jgi:hypothetical protein